MTNLHAVIPEEKLIEAYRLLLEMRDNCVKHADDQYDDPKREAKREALNIAMAAMGRSIPPRWISVEERMPRAGKAVLVSVRNTSSTLKWVMVDIWHGSWLENEDSDCHIVTHWMPLPEPPKEPEA